MNVSVVIPAYNAANTIARAIESVLAQTHPAAEIIIVDDGSPDDIAEAVAPYRDQVILLQKENGGAASARNLGIDTATGDLIAFLDADDYWEPAKLERHVELYKRHPQLGLSCGQYFNEEPGKTRELIPLTGVTLDQMSRPAGLDAFEWATRCWTGTVVARRELFGEDRFVSGLEPAEDRDLWVRLISKGPVYCLSEPLATAVLEPESLSRTNIDRDCGNMLRVIARHRHVMGLFASCKWSSHTHYRWSANTDDMGDAVRHYLQSVFLWPLPYGQNWVRRPFARARLLARLARQLVGNYWGLLVGRSRVEDRTADSVR